MTKKYTQCITYVWSESGRQKSWMLVFSTSLNKSNTYHIHSAVLHRCRPAEDVKLMILLELEERSNINKLLNDTDEQLLG